MGIIWSQRNSRATIYVGNHYDIVKQHMPKDRTISNDTCND